MVEICPCCNQVIRHESPLRQLRKRHGLTMTQLAQAAGLSVPSLSRLETEVSANPTLHTLAGLAKGLNCPVADVIAALE